MEEAIKQLKEVYLHIVEKLKGYPIIMSVIAALVAIVAAYSVYYHVKEQKHRHKLELLHQKKQTLEVLMKHQLDLKNAGVSEADINGMLETKLRELRQKPDGSTPYQLEVLNKHKSK